MATAKVSLTLPKALLTAARELAGQRGLSGYVAQALRSQLQRDRFTGLLDELEKEAGPIDPMLHEEVREAWTDPSPNRNQHRVA